MRLLQRIVIISHARHQSFLAKICLVNTVTTSTGIDPAHQGNPQVKTLFYIPTRWYL